MPFGILNKFCGGRIFSVILSCGNVSISCLGLTSGDLSNEKENNKVLNSSENKIIHVFQNYKLSPLGFFFLNQIKNEIPPFH